jgi:hypothetical protein
MLLDAKMASFSVLVREQRSVPNDEKIKVQNKKTKKYRGII